MNRRVQPELFVPGSAVVHHCASSCRRRVVCALRRRVVRRASQSESEPPRPRDASKADPCCRARHPADQKRTVPEMRKPDLAGEHHQARDLIHGAQPRRDRKLTAQYSLGPLRLLVHSRLQQLRARAPCKPYIGCTRRGPLFGVVAAREGLRGTRLHAPTPPTREAARKVRENAQKAHRSPAAGLEPQPFSP